MALSLIKTKFNPPLLRRSHISRLRLLEHLNQELLQGNVFTRRLTLICAPAGYGKSSLAADWLRSLSIQTAWFSLDEGDNDPVRFLSYLVHAIRQVMPEAGNAALGMLQSPKLPPPEALLTPLLNEIDARQTPFALVIDDYHLIENHLIASYMAFVLEYQPLHMHTVIVSREDPPLPLHRLRARGQLLEIRQEKIRFSSDETTDFLTCMLDHKLSAENIEAIRHRTEGWITGMQLLALSLRKEVDPNQFIQTFTGSDRFVLDYLFEEVFHQQPQEIQEFLLKTAVLENLSPDLCDAVTEGENSAELLEMLDQSNLFILPVNQTETWYRYHRLFLDLLRHRLRLQKKISEKDLHDKASHWYQQEGYLENAVHHALAGQEWRRAASLIEEASDRMLKQGAVTTMIRWFKAIPLEVVHENPGYCLNYAWPLLLASMVHEADALLDIAEEAARDEKVLLGEIASAQAFSAQIKGDEARLVERSELALSLLPVTNLSSRGIVSMNLGIAYWHAGEIEKAEHVLQEALFTFQRTDNKYGEVTSLFFLGRVHAVRGELRRAFGYTKRLLDLRLRVPIMVLAHLDMSMLQYEANDLELSEAHLEQAFEMVGSNHEFLIALLMQKARLKLALRESEAALAALEQARKIMTDNDIPQRSCSRLAACMVEAALALDDMKMAEHWASQVVVKQDAHSFYRFLYLTPIRLLMAKRQKGEVLALLEEVEREAQQKEWRFGLIVVYCMQALAAPDLEAGVDYLSKALVLASGEKFNRSFVDQGQGLIPLLCEAARRGVEPEYIGEILATFETEGEAGLPTGVEALSEREMEVMRLLAVGLTNSQIADQLVISISTVKSHVHHICGKLGAENRTQAVACAREFHIL